MQLFTLPYLLICIHIKTALLSDKAEHETKYRVAMHSLTPSYARLLFYFPKSEAAASPADIIEG